MDYTFRSEGARPQDLRARNSRMLLQSLSGTESQTINEIAEKMHLSRTAVKNILSNLIRKGMVIEGDKRNSTKLGGKRATSYRVCPEYKYSFFIYLSSDSIIVELNNFSLTQLLYRIEDASQFSYTELLDHIVKLINRILADKGLTKEDLYGIAIAVSGTVGNGNGVLIDLTGSNIPSKWGRNLPIAEDLRGRLEFEHDIYLDNMCNFSGYDRFSSLTSEDTHSCLYMLAHSRGIGATYIKDDRIEKGVHGLIGEIGHTTIDYGSEIECRCGRKGCFEAMLYPEMIRQRANLAIEQGLTTNLAMDSIKSVDDLLRETNEGNAYARDEIDRIGKLFAELIYNIQIMADPECIIFHDSFSSQCAYFHQSILAACSKKAEGYLKIPIHVLFETSLFSDCVRKGAASYLRDRYLDSYTEELI